MTSLFGCICNQPGRLTEALESVRGALVSGGPVARWGLGYVQAGQVLLSLHPRTAETGVDFYEQIEAIKSDYLVVASNGADGLKGNANTQPFRFRQWMFAQEGSIADFESVMPAFLEHIPPYLQRNMRGKAPSEHIFHLFLSMLHDSGRLDDPNLPAEESRRALRDTLALVFSVLTKSGGESTLGNIVITNSRTMVGVRLGGPLYVRRFKELTDARRPETQFKSVTLISAEELPGEGFEAIPERSVVEISRDVDARVIGLDG
jgi:glutamine amidotransferase